MREIDDHDELLALCGGDTLCLWAAQGLDGRGRAWASEDGRAVAVAGPGLSRRDRIAVRGPADAVMSLVRRALSELGPTYRPLGDPALIDAVVQGLPELVAGKAFGWMETTAAPPQVAGPARWLCEHELPEATDLLAAANPDSDAEPGISAGERWAGVRDEAGRLTAVAALVWSTPAVALIGGVAVHPDARGRGLGRAVCGFVLAEALARHHGSAALMVDDWNHAAIRLYRSLGMSYRPICAAYVASLTTAPALGR
jgi:ribosomal protein S18 acetylase RimI-like enzyme